MWSCTRVGIVLEEIAGLDLIVVVVAMFVVTDAILFIAYFCSKMLSRREVRWGKTGKPWWL